MKIISGFALAAVLLAAGCASYPVLSADITLPPGGRVHVHGQAVHVKAHSRGPGMLTITMLDAEGMELGGAELGIGRWSGGDRRVTDVWIRNGSEEVVRLDVRAGGTGTVAVATLEEPFGGRETR